MNQTIQILVSIIIGGGLWEGFKFFFPDMKRLFTSKITAKKTLYENIDPFLKSASDLYGKLESLAKEDFSTFKRPINSNSLDPDQNKKYVYFLFAQFWAQLESLRLENKYTTLSRIKKGRQLLKFIDTFESRKYRILDRSVQRIIGECLILGGQKKFNIMTLKEFVEEIDNPNTALHKWIGNLKEVLQSVDKQKQRQLILTYGVIIAAMIDHFDPESKTIRKRPIFINKLSPHSRQIIKIHLTTYYLDFLKKKERYFEIKKVGP